MAQSLVAGDVGHMSGFMAQAGTILIGGEAGDFLGDSLYEAVIYIGGKFRSLGSDARVEDLTEVDVARRQASLWTLTGFDHIQPEKSSGLPRPAAYNFDALKDQQY